MIARISKIHKENTHIIMIDAIFFVNMSQTKEHCESSALLFGTMCSAYAERDAPFGRDVAFGSDVRFAREKEHITSLCAKGAIHHYGKAITSLRRSRYITLYKQSKSCCNAYN